MPEVIDMDNLEGADPKQKLENMSIFELQFRRNILGQIATEAHNDGDERWHEAARQQRVVNTALVVKLKKQRRAKGQHEPRSVNIGMQPIRMTARRVKI